MSLNKFPPRIALTGDVLRMKETIVPVVADSLKKAILKEHKAAREASYGVSTILSFASASCRSRSEGLLSLLNEESSYNIFKFAIGKCVYINSSGSSHNINLDNFEPPKADLLLSFSAKLVVGINRSDPRRTLLLTIDQHGFDVIAKVPERATLLMFLNSTIGKSSGSHSRKQPRMLRTSAACWLSKKQLYRV